MALTSLVERMKKNRPKVPAPAPDRDPEIETAKAQLEAERQRRAVLCINEVRASLAKHRCAVVAYTVIRYDGTAPALSWDIEATAS